MSATPFSNWNLSIFYHSKDWPQLFRFLSQKLLDCYHCKPSSITPLIYLNFERGENLRVTLKGGQEQLNEFGSNFVRSIQQYLKSFPSRPTLFENAQKVFFMDCPSNSFWHSLFVASQPRDGFEQKMETLLSEVILIYFLHHEFNETSLFQLITCLLESTICGCVLPPSECAGQLLYYMDLFSTPKPASTQILQSNELFSSLPQNPLGVDKINATPPGRENFTLVLDQWKQMIASNIEGSIISQAQYFLLLHLLQRHLGHRTGSLPYESLRWIKKD